MARGDEDVICLPSSSLFSRVLSLLEFFFNFFNFQRSKMRTIWRVTFPRAADAVGNLTFFLAHTS